MTCWFSSSRNRIVARHESGVVAPGLHGAGGELKRGLYVLLGERGVSIFNIFEGGPVLKHVENEVNHDARALEARLAVTNVAVNRNVVVDVHNSNSIPPAHMTCQCTYT